MAFDVVTYILSKNYTDKCIAALPKGFIYKGAVNYFKDLPTNAEAGHVYTVIYRGESGTDPWGAEFVWGPYEGRNQWVEVGGNYDVEIAELKGSKQDKATLEADVADKGFTKNVGTITGVKMNGASKGTAGEVDLGTVITEHQSLKTINGSSIIGSGNVEIKTYQAFPASFITNSTTQAFVDSVFATTGAVAGMAYSGELRCTDLPTTPRGKFSNIEAIVTLMTDSNLVIDISTGSDGYTPYMWRFNSALHRWESWSKVIANPEQTTTNTLNKLSIDGVLYNIPGGGGTTVIANPELTGNEDELVSIQIGDTKYSNLNYHPFPDAFVTNKTLKEFGQSIVGYENFATGCTWFGGIQCTDLPGGMVQVECKVTAIRDTVDFTRNIAVVEIYSSEVAPFYWTYNTDSWSEGTGLDDWKYMAAIDGSKFDSTATINDPYDVKVRKVTAAANSKGWEFYTEKSDPVVANPTLAGTEANLTGIQVAGIKYKVPTGGSEPAEYLSSAEVDTNNNLKILNKNTQEVVNCTVNYTLDNAKVKAVLTETEKETLLSGVTGTTWIAAQTNISALQSSKQDVISDLADIRSGAALGATALQEVPNTYRTSAAQDIIDATKADIATTLSGYGITDAKIESGTITLGSNTITPITEHQSLSNYALKTEIPTKTSQLTNDSNYISKINTGNIVYCSTDDGTVSSVHYGWFADANIIPRRLNDGHILVPETPTNEGYATSKKYVDEGLNNKQDKLIAGTNITIAADGKTISATGGSSLYKHTVQLNNGTFNINFFAYSTCSTAYTAGELQDALMGGSAWHSSYAVIDGVGWVSVIMNYANIIALSGGAAGSYLTIHSSYTVSSCTISDSVSSI